MIRGAIARPPTPSLLILSRTRKLDRIGEDDELLALRLLCKTLGTTMPCVEEAFLHLRKKFQFRAGRQVLPETELGRNLT